MVPKATPVSPDPETLDDAAVRAKIFRQHPDTGAGAQIEYPPGWRLGRLPSSPLQIDLIVDDLRKGKSKAKLKADLLSDFGYDCPFFAARAHVVMAARAGRHEVARQVAIERARTAEAAARTTRDQISILLRNLSEDVDRDTSPFDRKPNPFSGPAEVKARRVAADERRALYTATLAALDDEIRVHAAAIAREAPLGPNGAKRGPKPQHWRLAFAQHLASIWYLLTGEMPAKAELSSFQPFVAAAWRDLGGLASAQWRSPVEKAVQRAATWEPWNHIDWMVNGTLPPDVDQPGYYATAAAARAHLTPRNAAHLRLCANGDPVVFAELLACQMAYAELTARDQRPAFVEVMEMARRLSCLKRRHWDLNRADNDGSAWAAAIADQSKNRN